MRRRISTGRAVRVRAPFGDGALGSVLITLVLSELKGRI